MSYSFEYIDIILLAMIAGFIFLRLRGILGKRTGFEGKAPGQFKEVLKNIKIELDALIEQSNKLILKDDETLRKNIQKLQDINEELWDIENAKRECEANKEFGEAFIKISRDVHFKNDIRASIKKEINLLSNSKITEEKEYSKY